MPNMKVSFGADLDQALATYQNKMDVALQMLGQKGFMPIQPPYYQTSGGNVPYRGELPHDLTALTDDHLGYYLGMLSEWNAFVQFQLAEADSQLTCSKAKLVTTEANLRMSYKFDEADKKRTSQEKDDCVHSDVRFIEANSNVIYWETIYRYIKAIAFSAEQAFSAVSRRITQRGQEVDRNRRDGNINGGTNIPQGPLFRRP